MSPAVVQAAEGLSRAQRGGMISASQAFAVLGLLRGAARLKRTVQNAAAKHAKRPEDFAPLLRAIKVGPTSSYWGQSWHGVAPARLCRRGRLVSALAWPCCAVCGGGRVLKPVWVQDLPLSEGTAKFLSGCLNMDGEASHPLGCRALTAPAVCSMREASLQQATDPIGGGRHVGKPSYGYV